MHIAQEIRDIKRVSHVANVLFKEGLGYVVEETGLKHHLPFAKKLMAHRFEEPSLPQVRLRRALEALGGTYIKLGQLLSLRPDLIPMEYCEELSQLQDNVAPFSAQEARKIIERELKKKVPELFWHFNDKPIAAASIAQVHEARLKNGRKVVVKIQRPDIREIMQSDIDIMYYFARKLEKNARYREYQPVGIVDEFKEYSERELDFTIEGRNADIFAKNFKNSKTLKVPRIYWELSTSRVLTMEKIEGAKLAESKASKEELAKKITDIMIKQVFEDGFFHADLHPGNVMVTDGKVAFLDFGIVGRMDSQLKSRGFSMLKAIMDNNAERVSSILTKTGAPSNETSMLLFRQDIEKTMRQWQDARHDRIRITQVMHQLFNVCLKHRIKLPVNLVLLGKGLVTAEATCKKLKPDFDFAEYSRKHIEKAASERIETAAKSFIKDSGRIIEMLSQFPEQVSGLMDKLKSGTVKVDISETDIKQLGMEIDRSSNRMAYGMIIAACIVGAAMTANIKAGPQLLGINTVAIMLFALAIVFGLVLMLSIRKEVRVKQT